MGLFDSVFGGSGNESIPGDQNILNTANAYQSATDAATNAMVAAAAAHGIPGPISTWSLNQLQAATGITPASNNPASPYLRQQSQYAKLMNGSNLQNQQNKRSNGASNTNNIQNSGRGSAIYSTPGSMGDTVDQRIRIRPFPSVAPQIYGGTKAPIPAPPTHDMAGINATIDAMNGAKKPTSNANTISSNNLMKIISETNGVIFPYTPDISGLTHSANYENISTVHTNQDFYVYKNTPSIQLSISGQFTASNYRESLYMFACMHFLRSCTKMHFGSSANDPYQGFPPPPLLLSGYGPMMFNDLPIILESVDFEYNKNIDYVPVYWDMNSGAASPNGATDGLNGSNTNGAAGKVTGRNITSKNIIAWVPIIQNIKVTVRIQNTPQRMKDFNWDQYMSGSLLTGSSINNKSGRKGGFM